MSLPHFDHLLVFPRLRVQNANAVSSPLTHGFPSITAFLGLAWALERKVRAAGLEVSFPAIGVLSHDHQEQATGSGFVHTFHLTRNPVGHDGRTAPIVEEGRIHLDLSLAFAVRCDRWTREPSSRDADVSLVAELLSASRIAGGTLHPSGRAAHRRCKPYVVDLSGNDEDRRLAFRKACMRLLPGFVLVSRDDRMQARLAELRNADATATQLDAWLSLARVNWTWRSDQNSTRAEWHHDRKDQGWLVPIPVGYGALGDLHPPGAVRNARDTTTPFRYVESLYSIGEWIGPHRLYSPEQMLWYADSQIDVGLYRARNDYGSGPDPYQDLYDFD